MPEELKSTNGAPKVFYANGCTPGTTSLDCVITFQMNLPHKGNDGELVNDKLDELNVFMSRPLAIAMAKMILAQNAETPVEEPKAR